MKKKILIAMAIVILAVALLMTYLIWLGHATRRDYFEGLRRLKMMEHNTTNPAPVHERNEQNE